MDQDNTAKELLHDIEGKICHVVLNRPAALNALNYEMVVDLSTCLDRVSENSDIHAIVVKGAGERAFCAGGDVKSAYQKGKTYKAGELSKEAAIEFFAVEYAMNKRLFHYEKPIIALMNGIVMGGGYGVAGPCKYRIASETTKFAMPEVAIGFFPDVGGVYYLNQCPGNVGRYMGVTGDTIEAEDVFFCGLATHFIPEADQKACMTEIADALKAHDSTASIDSVIEQVLSRYHQEPSKKGQLEVHFEAVNQCFAHSSVEQIMDSVEASNESWVKEKLELLHKRSPTSMKVALEYLKWSQNRAFDEVLDQDLVLAGHFLDGEDYYEGVRAVLVDKDHNPNWQPASVDKVDDEQILKLFPTA